MRRTDRLFEIVQMFRGGGLITARDLAERLEVSVRTVYRDVDTLVASGIPIEGERGVGFIMREPVFLPPLTLGGEELRALHLGMEIVRQTGDVELARGADRLLGKITAVLPTDRRALRPMADMAVYAALTAVSNEHLGALRRAVAERRVLQIAYRSLDDASTERRIRPLQTEYWGRVWTCVAWCELRDAFRVLRVDRIDACGDTGECFEPVEGRSYADYLQSMKLAAASEEVRS